MEPRRKSPKAEIAAAILGAAFFKLLHGLGHGDDYPLPSVSYTLGERGPKNRTRRALAHSCRTPPEKPSPPGKRAKLQSWLTAGWWLSPRVGSLSARPGTSHYYFFLPASEPSPIVVQGNSVGAGNGD